MGDTPGPVSRPAPSITPVMQTRLGPKGNCFAACLATLTGEPLAYFDIEPEPEGEWLKQYDALLQPLGYTYTEFDPQKTFAWCGECYMLGCGPSPRGRPHAVIVLHRVGRKGFHQYEFVHDPHPEGGWVELTHVGVLLPTWKRT